MRSYAKKILVVVCCVLITMSMAVTAYAATLSYWYSDSSYIGKWTYSPKVWYSKIDSSGSFAFLSGLLNGKDIWNDALDLSVAVSSSYTSAPIKYYGGTKAQLDALNIFDPVPTSNLGLTSYTDITYSGTHTYSGSTKSWYTYHEINGYVVSRTDMNYNNYLKTASHELGHGLGWRGHPSSNQSTWVMQQGILENITLSTNEKRHLSQIY